MANTKIESEFITGILEEKIDKEIFDNFDVRNLKVYADVFEWLFTYIKQNTKLPTIELVKTRFPKFISVAVINDPKEIVKALRVNAEHDIFNQDLIATVNILKKTGDVKKAKSFLSERIDLPIEDSRPDVYEITSDKFEIGKDDFIARKKALVSGGQVGIPSGFGQEFDNFIGGGWENGNLYGVTGITGIGKSWIAGVMATAAMRAKYSPFYLALEGNITREYYRTLSIATEISNSETRSGKLDYDQFEWAEKRLRDIAKETDSKFWLATFGDREYYTPQVLRQKIRQYKPSLVIVDYITLMSPNNDGTNDWEAFLNISKQLAVMAKGLNIPIVAILQGTISSSGKNELDIGDIASSKGMSRDFDEILGLTRVKGKQYWIRVNSMKARDGVGNYSAYYQTNWDKGQIKFHAFADPDEDIL